MNVSGEKVNELPINFGGGGTAGGGIRNWLSFTYLAPGVAGTVPAQVNGLPGGNYKVYLEGQDSTSPMRSAGPAPCRRPRSKRSPSSPCSPRTSRRNMARCWADCTTSPPRAAPTSIHGSAYEKWANEVLDRAAPFNHVGTRTGRTTTASPSAVRCGFPKSTTARTGRSSSSTWNGSATIRPAASTGTVPTAAYRTGRFRLRAVRHTTNCTGPTVTLTDPTSGYQYLQNQIFDPATTTHGSERAAHSHAFPNNMIPADPSRPVALKIQAMIPAPISARPRQNWAPNIVTQTRAADPQPQDRSEFRLPRR